MYRSAIRMGIVFLGLLGAARVEAFPTILSAWQTKYPTSTIDERMAALTGTNCNTCHHPPSRSDLGNCYREDIRTLLGLGRTITEAIDELDAADSDGDGVPNGVEITTPRTDQPGEVGYSMGLIGATGTDPCAVNPAEVVTNQRETPIAAPVPTLGEWGLVALTLALLCAGSIAAMNRAPARAL